MSIEYSNRVWKLTELKGGKKLVMLALADHADKQGECHPGMQLLVEKTGLTDRQIRRIINDLAGNDYISIEQRAIGRGKRPHYQLFPDAEKRTFPTVKADISDTEKRTFVTGKADICDENQSHARSEPPREPEESNRAHRRTPYRADEQGDGYRAAAKQGETMRQVAALDVDKAVFRQIVTAVLEWVGRKSIADLNSDMGDKELYAAQECALSLVQMDFRSPDAVEAMQTRFDRVYHYFKTPPTYGQIVKFAAEVQSGKHAESSPQPQTSGVLDIDLDEVLYGQPC